MCKHDDDMMDRDDDYESAWENDDKGKFVFSWSRQPVNSLAVEPWVTTGTMSDKQWATSEQQQERRRGYRHSSPAHTARNRIPLNEVAALGCR